MNNKTINVIDVRQVAEMLTDYILCEQMCDIDNPNREDCIKCWEKEVEGWKNERRNDRH